MMKYNFGDVFEDVTKKGTKIPRMEYLAEGKYPVIDQGKEFIGGYTDKYDGIFNDVPAIIFGDHTRILKYVDTPFFIGADGVKILAPKLAGANCKYLYYALQKVYVPDTGYNRHFKWLKEADIVVHDVNKQNEIVGQLDLLTSMMNKHQLLLDRYDELVKSRFVEMFGDPVTNPMGWETGTLADVIRTKASNGFFAKRNAYNPDGNVAVLGVVDVVNRMYSKINDLPRTDATEKDIKKFRVGYGDILFCRSSLVQAGIGKASIVPRGISDDILFECHVIRLQLDMNKCLPEFVQILVSTEYCRNQLIAVSKTATMTTIGQDGVLATKIYIPPLDLQNKFLEVVELADKSKLTIQKSMDNLQELRDSLLQEYFG